MINSQKNLTVKADKKNPYTNAELTNTDWYIFLFLYENINEITKNDKTIEKPTIPSSSRD